MMYTVGIELEAGTARIEGYEDRNPDDPNWRPTPSYVYVEGSHNHQSKYLAQISSEWTVQDKLEFTTGSGTLSASVGTSIVIDLGVSGVSVELDGVSQGINSEETVEFTATTGGAFTLRFVLFPYVETEVTINAS
ncbi:MAG: hypothetical protein JKY34_10855 [Kordiimonadaceae bacterium]|nr:hypothetical protein [Kordiimonadaceae bacterium]